MSKTKALKGLTAVIAVGAFYSNPVWASHPLDTEGNPIVDQWVQPGALIYVDMAWWPHYYHAYCDLAPPEPEAAPAPEDAQTAAPAEPEPEAPEADKPKAEAKPKEAKPKAPPKPKAEGKGKTAKAAPASSAPEAAPAPEDAQTAAPAEPEPEKGGKG